MGNSEGKGRPMRGRTIGILEAFAIDQVEVRMNGIWRCHDHRPSNSSDPMAKAAIVRERH